MWNVLKMAALIKLVQALLFGRSRKDTGRKAQRARRRRPA